MSDGDPATGYERPGPARGSRWRLRPLLPRIDPRSGLGLAVGLLLIMCLAALAAGLQQYWRSFAQNTAADLIGAVVTIYVITPIIERSDQNRVREHPVLDYPGYIVRAQRAEYQIRVLDTFSPLLLEPHASQFRDAVRAALARGASVQMLLLNPTTLAAEQRALELGDPDLHDKVLRNLNTLRELRHAFDRVGGGLPGRPAGAHFEVRLYSSAPSISLHQWDNRALVSFFPSSRRSNERTQLEVSMDTGVGQFVGNQFTDLWRTAAPFEALKRVTLDDGSLERSYLVKFVDFFKDTYLVSTRVENYIAHARGPVSACRGDRVAARYTLEPVNPAETQLIGALRGRFRSAYGEPPNAGFLRLESIPDAEVDGDRALAAASDAVGDTAPRRAGGDAVPNQAPGPGSGADATTAAG